GGGTHASPGHLGPEMWVRAGSPTRLSNRPQGLTALDALTLGDRDRVEVEVGGVEPEAVVQNDEPSREEELAHESDFPGVDRHHGRSRRRRKVTAGVR